MILEVSQSLLHVLRFVAVLDGHLEHLDEPLEGVLIHGADVGQALFNFKKSSSYNKYNIHEHGNITDRIL